MLIIEDVLAAEDVERVRTALESARFRDGRATAGASARKVKRNEQAAGGDPAIDALGRFVRQALERHPVFALWAQPARWSHVLFSRYRPGQAYGLHVDDAIMAAADGGRMRTDLSFTLFLSDPESYSGGALVVEDAYGEREARLPAGGAVVYPTGSPHRVAEVTSGERLAAVGWIQSRFRRPDQREIVFDLSRLRTAAPEGEPKLLLEKSISALTRMWGEP